MYKTVFKQSILKEIKIPDYSLEGLMLKLKLQFFGHLMWRAESLEKTLMLKRLKAGGKGDYRGWDGWMASLTQWTWVWVDSRSWWWAGRPGVLQFMGSQRVRHDWATELNWTKSKLSENVFSPFFQKQVASLKLPVFKPSACSFGRAILGKLTDKDFGQAPWGPSYLLGTAGISLQAV